MGGKSCTTKNGGTFGGDGRNHRRFGLKPKWPMNFSSELLAVKRPPRPLAGGEYV
jgi:hypothetical protein